MSGFSERGLPSPVSLEGIKGLTRYPQITPLLMIAGDSHTDQSCVMLAVEGFLSQDPALLRSLKEFLLILPSPQAIETVLTQALYQVAVTHPQVC
ncbi:MAG: hypothetical protein F6K03_11565, partial [Kamptonema sp. SIO4C4]|nr:hypothetical protein [Kamptonema sp. SIO4C4]